MNDVRDYKKVSYESVDLLVENNNTEPPRISVCDENSIYLDGDYLQDVESDIYSECVYDTSTCDYACLQTCMFETWNNYPVCASKCSCQIGIILQ